MDASQAPSSLSCVTREDGPDEPPYTGGGASLEVPPSPGSGRERVSRLSSRLSSSRNLARDHSSARLSARSSSELAVGGRGKEPRLSRSNIDEIEIPDEVVCFQSADRDAICARRRHRRELWEDGQGTFALLECMQADDVDMRLLKRLVKDRSKARLNAKDQVFGWTPLHYAANKGSVKLIQLLLASKADKNATCKNGNSLMHLAARGGHADAVRFLLTHSIDLRMRNSNGWTAFLWAAINGHGEVTSVLAEARASVEVQDEQGMTAGMWAARNGHSQVMQVLLEQGFDLQTLDVQGNTVADHAQEFLEIRKALLGAEQVNQELLDAVQRNDEDAARLAIEQGAFVNARDDVGWTPLTWSAMYRSLGLVQLLAQHNADPAILEESAEVIHELSIGSAEERAEMDRVLQTSLTASGRLLAAAHADDWEAVEAELGAGALVNSKEEESHLTCLMYAATHCNIEAVMMLVSQRAALEQRDSTGWTAAHFATQTRNAEIVAVLHHLKADMSATGYDGSTAQHIAARADDAAMVQVLLAARCSVDDVNSVGTAPIQVAVAWGSTSALLAFLVCGADTSVCDGQGRSLMALASVRGHLRAAAALLSPPQCGREASEEESEALPEVDEESDEFSRQMSSESRATALQAGGSSWATTKLPESDPRLTLLRSAGDMREVLFSQPPPEIDREQVLNSCDEDGRAPLALAIHAGHEQLVTFLLEQKAAVDASDLNGDTALMLAASLGDLPFVEQLFAAGASLSTVNEAGKVAVDLVATEEVRAFFDKDSVQAVLKGRGGGGGGGGGARARAQRSSAGDVARR